MCNTHYLRTKRHGDAGFRLKAANGEVSSKRCLVSGCETTAKAKGYCGMHFQRVHRHGDPLLGAKRPKPTPEELKARKAREQKRYQQTPHGKMRSRFNVHQMRTRTAKVQKGIPKEVFQRLWDTPACALCGSPFLADAEKSIDHKKPLSRGGDNGIENLQLAHLGCNQRKSNTFVCA